MLQIDKIENSSTFELCYICNGKEPNKNVYTRHIESPHIIEVFTMHGKCISKFREKIKNAK